jgi:hypothetical protein
MTQFLDLGWLTEPFNPITLDGLNEKAEMMSRIDNKYVIQAADLKRLVPAFTKDFDVLDIKDQRTFTYDTRYFDDAGHSAYFEHHQGIRKGFKVRVRRYVEAGLCFLEVKVKGQRGMTEKYRMPYDPSCLNGLTSEARDFAQTTYSAKYDKPFGYQLRPSLDIRYKRITLVAKSGGERMTIDTDLRFTTTDHTMATGTSVFIVETKSANGRGVADVLLRTAGERPARRCSKYCVGLAAMGQVSRYNRFLPTLRQLGLTTPRPAIGQWSEIRTDLRQSLAGSSPVPQIAAA